MIVTQAPAKANWIPALLFIAVAAALSAYVSYLVQKRLKENE